MSKAETAIALFDKYNCAQSVAAAYASHFGLEKDRALQAAVGFGGGLGRHQEVCGAVSGAVIILGLASEFTEEDSRPKINAVYSKVHSLIDEFAKEKGSFKCRDLLGCDLLSEEGQKYFREHNLKEKCRDYVRFCCDLLDKYLEDKQ